MTEGQFTEIMAAIRNLEVKLDLVLKTLPKRGRVKVEESVVHTDNVWVRHIFEFWNKQEGIPHHRVIPEKAEKKIRVLKKQGYTLDEITNAIANYAMVMRSDDYFFPLPDKPKYKWTLDEFLYRGLTKFMDRETVEHNYRKKPGKTQPKIFENIEPVAIVGKYGEVQNSNGGSNGD